MLRTSSVENQVKILREQMKDHNEIKNESFARLLKRRRIEQNKTLEEVATGVCSTSYLCRIENAQVDVDDSFYEHLFEKLEIPYNEVKKQEKQNILKELVKRYIQDDYKNLLKIIDEGLASLVYSDIEQKLIILFKLIVLKEYDKAKELLSSIDKVMDTLSNDELIIYTYLSSTLAFKINNIYSAYRLIRVLSGLKFNDNLLDEAILDLALSIYAMLDEDLLFTLNYNKYQKLIFSKSSASRKLKHKIEYLQIIGKVDFDKGYDALMEIKDSANSNEELEHYEYNYLKLLVNFGKFEEVINTFNDLLVSPRVLTLIDYSLMMLEDKELNNKFMNLLTDYKFTKFESFYLMYNELARKVMKDSSSQDIVNFIKENCLKTKITTYDIKNSLIFDSIYFIYMKSLFKVGKYKEIAKYTLKF